MKKTKTLYASLLSIVTWLCLIVQFYISTDKFGNTISYFTILTNILVAASLTFIIFFPETILGKYFSRRSVKSSITLYIFFVGLIYNLLLRNLIKPVGWQLFLDNMLHVFTPVAYILFWAYFDKREKLTWRNGLFWLIFPCIYVLYSLARGAFENWYPYPFLAANVYGYKKILLYVILLLCSTYFVGLILISINNVLFKKDVSKKNI